MIQDISMPKVGGGTRRVHPQKSLTGLMPAHLLVHRGIPLLPDDRKKDCFFCTLFQDISKTKVFWGSKGAIFQKSPLYDGDNKMIQKKIKEIKKEAYDD